MDIERKDGTTLKGRSFTLVGPELKAGDRAPEFTLLDVNLAPVTLADSKGKTRLILAVPSLDTPVCDTETRRFNEEAAKLGGAAVLTVSVDLPFAQNRFCMTAGIKNLQVLSDHKDTSFGKAYGCLIKELRLLSRAVFVVGVDEKLQYVEYVKDVASHPNYEAALSAVRQTVPAR